MSDAKEHIDAINLQMHELIADGHIEEDRADELLAFQQVEDAMHGLRQVLEINRKITGSENKHGT